MNLSQPDQARKSLPAEQVICDQQARKMRKLRSERSASAHAFSSNGRPHAQARPGSPPGVICSIRVSKSTIRLTRADARKIGVRVAAPAGGIHLENTAHLQPALLHELPDLLLQPFRLDRLELEKKRLDHIGRDIHHENAEDQQKSPDPEPPPGRAGLTMDRADRSHDPTRGPGRWKGILPDQ